MYNYKDITSLHVELTSKCQARCPMCPRRINGGMLNPLIDLEEITLEQFKTWFPTDFIKQLIYINFCGNLGDPIIARDTLEIIQYLKSIHPGISLAMHTNGSARDEAWWRELAASDVRVTFGIDGLEDNHALYRIGTDWNKIIKNAKAFIDAGGRAEWHMLVFKHNEHQIEDCRALSQEYNFSSFTIKHTTRFQEGKFHVLDEQGKTTHILYPTKLSEDMISKAQAAAKEIKPIIKCKVKTDKQMYISANGKISPCCWLDFEWILPKQDSRIDYMDRIGKFPSLQESTLEEIFDSNFFNDIESTWNDIPLKECSKQCGSFDKLNSQYVERVKQVVEE
jgi:MoaA/NifB/PqqE/SkfB family radical SAM enzyme